MTCYLIADGVAFQSTTLAVLANAASGDNQGGMAAGNVRTRGGEANTRCPCLRLSV